jgi:hypothetical protein
MVSLFFFILAANNVIKVVRDSLFLSRFPISDLAYVYLLAAVIAGVIISGYTRYTVRMPLYRFILVSNAFIISNVILFWFLIVFFNLSWAIYAFYLGVPGFDRIWCRCDRSFEGVTLGSQDLS